MSERESTQSLDTKELEDMIDFNHQLEEVKQSFDTTLRVGRIQDLDHKLDPDHQFKELDAKQEYRWVERPQPEQGDPVNSPSHYNSKGVEAIDAIEASMSDEEFQGYCKGNAMKYMWRYKYKGKPVEDLKKAQWYLNKLIASLETM